MVGFGHTVAIATHEIFRDFVAKNGPSLEFLPLDGDPGAIMSSDEFKRAFFEGSNTEQMKLMLAESAKYTYKNHVNIWKHAQAFKPTGILAGFVNHPECLAVCQKLCVPLLTACTVPVYPSEHTLPVGTTDPTTFGWLNKFANYAMWKLQWLMLGPDVNKFRENVLQLPKVGQQHFDAAPMFNMFSSIVFPPPPDYPPHVITTGYWIMPPADDYSPPDDLASFLAGGEKPVYMGFGSMPVQHPNNVLEEFGKALKAINLRGIYCGGWTDLDDLQAPDNVFMIRGAPHEWLLPQCAAAIHHGGAGTTAASMRAGIPTIVCPVLIDQPFWASRVVTLGNGQNKIKPLKELDHEFLEEQLRHCMTEEVQKTARDVGERLRQEDGIKEAAAYTIGYLNERCVEGIQLNYMPDSESSVCTVCNAAFTLFFRRHHCMSCGALACSNCVKYLDVTNFSTFRYCCQKCAKIRKLSWE
eukprot:CAMPEP_0114618634 /NCGR_PEP_ID=MMETSP0168-20121206/7800_1 /TAXON_ID=95228 ORGANISM="Vannella sp., Strain DIVA3 517/6/12" /NCGR_SAMPLE_ID=MMETSP0168 /ASSEMBLY_ACC=CAM_ASM_000044 /LENGTH=468 /DNA_ID=CAMNT_0001829779 /DNA_START=77 /DNA_END=1480 /DNA_ORIENTATION=-